MGPAKQSCVWPRQVPQGHGNGWGTWCEGSTVEMLNVSVDGKPGTRPQAGRLLRGQGGEGSGASRERTDGCCSGTTPLRAG